jgi:hypothetical protein
VADGVLAGADPITGRRPVVLFGPLAFRRQRKLTLKVVCSWW